MNNSDSVHLVNGAKLVFITSSTLTTHISGMQHIQERRGQNKRFSLTVNGWSVCMGPLRSTVSSLSPRVPGLSAAAKRILAHTEMGHWHISLYETRNLCSLERTASS